jgi:hypothetical protein
VQERAGTTDATLAIPGNKRYRFQFLYNPESININTNVFSGTVDPGFQNQADPLQAKFVGQESLSFGLMLDRSHEVYEQGARKTRGTLPDIEALYRVVNGSRGINAGFLYLSEVVCYFGPANALAPFRGYVTSINITHTKFTAHMTPIRSIVDLSMARLADTAAGEQANQLYAGGSLFTAGLAPSAPPQPGASSAGQGRPDSATSAGSTLGGPKA